DQRDVIDEVDVQEIVDFRLCEATFDGKETAIKGLPATAVDGCDEVGPVVRPQRADFDSASIAQPLERRVVGRFQHDRQLFAKPHRTAWNSIASTDKHVPPLRPSADGGAVHTTFGK